MVPTFSFCVAIISLTLAMPFWMFALMLVCIAPMDLVTLADTEFDADARAAYFTVDVLLVSFYGWQHKINRAVHVAMRHLSELSTSKERYVAAISHDFGTPTSGLEMAMDALAAGRPLSELSNGIRASITMLKILRSKALNLSTLEAGEVLQPQFSAVSIPEVFGQLEALCAIMPQKREHVRVRFFCHEAPERVQSDASWLLMMCVNMLSNALKHTSHGEVVITARCAAGSLLELSVADTGSGVPSLSLIHI